MEWRFLSAAPTMFRGESSMKKSYSRLLLSVYVGTRTNCSLSMFCQLNHFLTSGTVLSVLPVTMSTVWSRLRRFTVPARLFSVGGILSHRTHASVKISSNCFRVKPKVFQKFQLFTSSFFRERPEN